MIEWQKDKVAGFLLLDRGGDSGIWDGDYDDGGGGGDSGDAGGGIDALVLDGGRAGSGGGGVMYW